MSEISSEFGNALRQRRLEKRFTLRKFAELIGVSPTYLSQVEQGHMKPPTVERVRAIARLLEVNEEEWIGMAGRVPEDLSDIIRQQPTEMPELLREVNGLNPDQLRELIRNARAMKQED